MKNKLKSLISSIEKLQPKINVFWHYDHASFKYLTDSKEWKDLKKLVEDLEHQEIKTCLYDD
jgi:hypothetical protein